MAIAAWNNTADGEGEPSWASLAREFRASQMRFILHVPSWEAYKPLQVLQWDSIPYESKDLPVNKRGVYAFVLDIGVHSDSPLPPHACVLYVGETGDNGNATLASRLTNYRNKKAQRDRPQIWSMSSGLTCSPTGIWMKRSASASVTGNEGGRWSGGRWLVRCTGGP